jgi:predicted NBD/HSP70 family sugar kinase
MGRGRSIRNFLYLFIGTFIGGGVVVDGRLHPGPRGNAGAVGSLPFAGGHNGIPRQLLHQASGLGLEQRLIGRGLSPAAAHDEQAMAAEHWPATQAWLEDACPALALTVTASTALLDLDAVIIDGSIDRRLIAKIIGGTQGILSQYDWEGIAQPELLPGSIGPDARAMGGAILPLYAHFAPTHDLFLKSENTV